MRVEVNGEARELDQPALRPLLAALGVDEGRPGVAVARNGEVVARSAWDEVVLRDGDRLEVLTAVQGG